MICDALYADVSFGRQVSDGDKDRIFDARQTNHPAMAHSDFLVPGEEPEKTVHKVAKLPIAVAG